MKKTIEEVKAIIEDTDASTTVRIRHLTLLEEHYANTHQELLYAANNCITALDEIYHGANVNISDILDEVEPAIQNAETVEVAG